MTEQEAQGAWHLGHPQDSSLSQPASSHCSVWQSSPTRERDKGAWPVPEKPPGACGKALAPMQEWSQATLWKPTGSRVH